MKKVVSANGKKSYLYPKKGVLLCYRNVKSALQDLLNQPGFTNLLHFGPHYSETDTMYDISDGDIKSQSPKEFLNSEEGCKLVKRVVDVHCGGVRSNNIKTKVYLDKKEKKKIMAN